MPMQLITPPAGEPVSLAEAKLHLRVDFDDDDSLIQVLISAARQAAETLTNRQLVTARWRMVLDSFPGPSLMGVPAGQVFTLPGHAVLLQIARAVGGGNPLSGHGGCLAGHASSELHR